MGKEIVEKLCKVCKQSKPLSEFIKDKAYKDGYRNECKQCKNKRMNKYLESWTSSNIDSPSEKKCKQCKKVKPISEFCKDKYYKDGYHHICKSCQSKRQKEMKLRWKKERKQKSKTLESKICTKCNKTLSISQFTRSVNSKDGFDSICKNCRKQRKMEYKQRWRKERLQNPDAAKEKECPSCHKILLLSDFYDSDNHKDGLSFYCKRCSLQKQKRFAQKWEKIRSEKRTMIKEKECNICHRVLTIDKFYKNRRFKDGISATCISCETKRQTGYIANWKEKRNQQEELLTAKECIQCHRILPISSFNKNKRRKDGLTSLCKDCESKRQEDYIDKWSEERKKEKKADSFTLFPTFEKKCITCKRTLPTSRFYPKVRSKDGLSSNCMECDRKLAKDARKRFLKSGRWKENLKNIPEDKECRRCHKILPSSQFDRRKESKDGLSLYCKPCVSIKNKEYRYNPKTREGLLKQQREHSKKPEVRERNRKWAREYAKRSYVREKRKKYLKEYCARPEVKEHRKQYLKEYHKRKKQEAMKS